MKLVIIIAIAVVLLIPIPVFASSHPEWVESILTWYEEGRISEQEIINAIEYLINIEILKEDYLEKELTQHDCSGTARCITGTVTSVIDGDTIKVDGQSIRFTLVSAPDLNKLGGNIAKEFIEDICPVGSTAIVDEDDGKMKGIYGRILGIIHCNGVNLNEELLDAGLGHIFLESCIDSEFANDFWAVKYGCIQVSKETTDNCNPSYPDFCIPYSPPNLDCKDIPQKNFTVLQPDPHRFDVNKNGIGCES